MNFGQWIGLISLIISLYILWQIRILLLLIFASVILATACNRLVRFLQRFKLKRSYAISLIFVHSLVFAAIFLWLILPPFISQLEELAKLLPSVWDYLSFQLNQLRKQQFDWLPATPSLSELIGQLQPLGTELFRNFVSFFSNSLGIFVQILFVLVLTLMLTADPQPYRQTLLRLFPSFYRRRADEILSLSELALVNWMTGILITSIFIGLLSGVGLYFLKVQLVLAHAFLAGLLNFIPNIGPTISVIFPVMITVISDPWKIILIIIWYVIIQNLESYWLTPTIMSKQVSLLPAITLMAQIFFTTFFGPLGLLLALPLTVVAKTWLSELLCKDVLDKWTDQPIESLPYQLSSPEILENIPKDD